jgi:hypothetical protein
MSKFWKMVELADFSGHNFDPIASKNTLVALGFKKEDFTMCLSELNKCHENLDNACKSINHTIGKGEDGLIDLFSYIVSEGKKEYLSYLENSSQIKKLDSDSFNPESFIYVFI